MPLDHGCRLDQHQGVQGLRPNAVKPHPEEPVDADKLRTAWTLAPQNGQLVAKRDELKFERSTAAEAKREQGNQCGKNDNHADDGMAAAPESLGFLGISEF
jgi:hypothetical protein